MESSLPTVAMTTYQVNGTDELILPTAGDSHKVWRISEILFLIILAIFISIGNGLNILTLRSSHYIQSIHGCLLVSLAVADIGLGPITAIAALSAVYQQQWYGSYVCEAIAFLGELFRCVSLSMLTLLNLEKYFAILHPLRYTVVVTRRRTISVVCLLWATLTVMYIIINKFTPDGFVYNRYSENTYTCMPGHNDGDTTGLILTISLLSPSFVVITYTSAQIMKKIAVSAKRRRRLFAGCSSQCPKRKLSKLQRMLPSSLRHNMKAFRVLLVISGMVYVTWLPFTLCTVIALLRGERGNVSHARDFVAFWLTVSNSGCNIVIYYVMDAKYRRALCIMAGKLFRKQAGNLEGLHSHEKVNMMTSADGRHGNSRAAMGRKMALIALNTGVPAEGRPRFYRIGIRNENGSITPTDVKITSPPVSVTPRRRFRQVLYDDMNIHSQTGGRRPTFLPFYSIPNGAVTNGPSIRRMTEHFATLRRLSNV